MSAEDIGTTVAWRNQRFEAWGTSLGWMGNEVGGWKNQSKSDVFYELLFDEVNHLGLNYVRYNIGAGQAPGLSIPRPGSLMDGWVPSLPSKPLDSNTWQYDWSADAKQRRFLDQAISRGAVQVEAYANSAPWWMTVSGDVTGASDKGQDNLSPANYDIFAEYLATVSRHFQDNLGTRFSTLAPMNEPCAGWWNSPGNQEGMNVSKGANQSALLIATHNAINHAGLPIKLVAPEETSSVESLSSYLQMSAAAKQVTWQINTHTYPFLTGTTNDSLESLKTIARDNNKKLYVSEFGVGGKQLSSGLTLASRISTDLKRSGAKGWTYWQALENDNGSRWGLMTSCFGGAEDYTLRKQYAFMRHFTSYLRAGSYVLNVGDDSVVAAYNPHLDATVLVITNDSKNAVDKKYDFIDKQITDTRVIRTNKTDTYTSLGPANVRGQSSDIAASRKGVTTLLVHHRDNLIDNARFELGAHKAVSAKTLEGGWYSEGDARFSSSLDNSNDGSGAAVLLTDKTNHNGAIRQEAIAFIEDQSGVAFQLSLDVLFQNDDSSSQHYNADTLIGIEFMGKDGQTLAHRSDRDYLTEINPIYSDSDYRVFQSEVFEAPEGSMYARPVIRYEKVGSNSTDWTFLDNVRLQQVHKQHRGRVFVGGEWEAFDSWIWDADMSRDQDIIFNSIAKTNSATINKKVVVSKIVFDQSEGMSINGNESISLDSGANESFVDVRQGNHTINVPLLANNSLVIRVLPEAKLRLSGELNLAGFRLDKQGAGDLQLENLKLSGGELAVKLTETAQIAIDNEAMLGGTVIGRLGKGVELSIGQQFRLLTYGTLVTPATKLNLPQLPANADWQVRYLPNYLHAEVVDAKLPGDYNSDGFVNIADYFVWRDQVGLLGSSITADGNEDGVVDFHDFKVWITSHQISMTLTQFSIPMPNNHYFGALAVTSPLLNSKFNKYIR